MASLATAKAGEEVTLPGGKVVIADGKGGGRVKRKKKVASNGETAQKKQQEQAAAEAQAAVEAAAVVAKPAQNEGTVARGIRAAAEQGSRVSDLIRQTQGRPR
jgi:hypothetical protein